jgi:heat shock protein HtpX
MADQHTATNAAALDRRELLLCALPAGALLLLGLLLSFAVGPVAMIVAALLASALVALALLGAEGLVARATGARPADPDTYPRYHNLVSGLCLDAGLRAPRLLLVEADAPNALSFGGPQRGAVVVTTGLLDGLNLVELEAALAVLVERTRSHAAQLGTVAAVMGGLAGLLWYTTGRSLAWLGAPLVPLQRLLPARQIDLDADERGAMLTRYPPGLVGALAKAAAADPAGTPAGARALAHLWLVEPPAGVRAEEPGWLWAGLERASVDERIAELREL